MTRSPTELRAAASARGIQTRFVDSGGEWRDADPDSLVRVLEALGPPPEPRALPPVVVAWNGTAPPVRVSAQAARVEGARVEGARIEGARVDVTIDVIGGGQRSWSVDLAGDSMLALPGALPFGRHRLLVEGDGIAGDSTIVSAPGRLPSGRLETPAWGVFAPLYSIRSARDRGVGDFRDLEELGARLAQYGATVTGTLPLLAAFTDAPCEPSPYSPVSRRFWNELHVDLERAVARYGNGETRAVFDALGEECAQLRATTMVDRARCAAVVDAVLDSLARQPDPDELTTFLAARPEVEDYARFRAASTRFGRDWRRWDPPLRTAPIPIEVLDGRVVRIHRWAQFLAATQLGELATRLGEHEVLLYLDLPLGSHPEGFDQWRDPDSFVNGVSLGAPPDAFFAGGQRWDLAPPHPQRCRENVFATLRRALAAHLEFASILRIDHAIGLHRQWWIPDGAPAGKGVYVTQPAEELWSVLCLAAHEAGAVLVAEDLGTVPPEVEDAIREHRAAGMFVAQWELADDRGAEPALVRAVPEHTVASLNTHDLPPFAAFWAAHPRSVDAASARDALLDTLGRSHAGVVLVSLDDLWLETEPQNQPGTVNDSNWRRRSRRPIEALHECGPTLQRLDSARRSARDPRPVGGAGVLFTALDAHLLGEGTHFDLHHKLGAHLHIDNGVAGVVFAVWAPNARRVRVVGDFDGWQHGAELIPVQRSGVWEGFVAGARAGHRYKYRIVGPHGDEHEKADPLATANELPPGNASIVTNSTFVWTDERWLEQRHDLQGPGSPISVYEVHLGSWRRDPEQPERLLGYRELAPLLAEHCLDMRFTHVELLPVMEHPFYGSWGYQVTGFFAPTARHGSPDDLRYLIDHLHGCGIGVVLDWVPAHFPDDAHGLARFDGTALYEHADPREGRHPDWGSLIFNYGRHEVAAFLVSSACCWLDDFHADGLRVDAVASMLYRDYSRAAGEWVPNRYGGRENLEALAFLRRCAEEVGRRHPAALFVAEESTAWPGVTAPLEEGGLGFTHKWDMGWMHDTLRYLARDPVHRRHHQDDITFRGLYANSERFMLPLSHDEVVHGKGSLVAKMAGDEWQQRANLRLLLGLQHGMPGASLLFMGGEFGQRREWDHDTSIDWHLLADPAHASIAAWVRVLHRLVRDQPALHERDDDPHTFEWIDCTDNAHSAFIWCRRGAHADATLVLVLNGTPVPRPGYRVGLPHPDGWELLVNSDDPRFGGSGHEVVAAVDADGIPWHSRPWSARLTLPPLGLLVYGRRS